MSKSFAIYRLPHEDHATLVQQTDGEPAELFSCNELNGKRGFVVAPFEVRTDQPILLIRPDITKVVGLDVSPSSPRRVPSPDKQSSPTGSYAIDFANFHAQLKMEAFRKIVLARCAEESTPGSLPPMELFMSACALYPRMFIALVNTPKSGCWLTATPEVLLESKGNGLWQTIALAGTMKLEGELLASEGETVNWSTKNIQEQRYVATYIAECLEEYTNDFREEGPYTVRAADLVHLRSDFNFSLPSEERVGDLLQTLYPTPAVCGLPKKEAFQFIVRNECVPRRYYSGFMGPLDGQTTHLYVSLRCMNIQDNHYLLYAGGGLLKDSTMEQEWMETEAKLETMRKCIAIRKM